MDYFSSDWHLGHRHIITMGKRPFTTVEEMDEYIEQMVFDTCKRNDAIYFLGDLSFNTTLAEQFLQKIQKRKIQFHWILGNHDEKLPINRLQQYCASVSARRVIKREKTYIHLCHFPQLIWTGSFRNSFHLYGHVHKGSFELNELKRRAEGKCLCVNLEFHNQKMLTLHDIFDYMETREDNWDFKLKEK